MKGRMTSRYDSSIGAYIIVALFHAVVLGVLPAEAQTAPEGPQQPPYSADRSIAIVGGLLIDATGASPRHDQTVRIEEGRIVEIGPMEQIEIPAGAHVIDASGMTIMPGLIDFNQHIVLNPLVSTPDMDFTLEEFKERWERNWAQMERQAYTYLMQGVTSFRQTPGPADLELDLIRRIEDGEVAGPRIFLGGALWMSEPHFQSHLASYGQTDPAAIEFIRHQFEYNVIKDTTELDPNGWGVEGPDFNFWKLYMWEETFDGENDFTDAELRFIIDRAHTLGISIDVHAGGHNIGLRRMLEYDIDTLEHPFYGHEIIDWDVINGYVDKGVIVGTLLQVMIGRAERAADPHRFNQTLYTMSLEPWEHRLLMRYRDKMLWNQRHPDEPGFTIYPEDSDERGRSYNEQMRQRETSIENMRRFIMAGAKFWMGTDTGAWMALRQENPQAREMMWMVRLGMDPLDAIQAATRNGAEGLGMLDELGTIEVGKLADVIVVAGNPLEDMLGAMSSVYAVIKDGIRYK